MMIMVKLSSLAQYPIQKIINGDTVVIMTKKQAIEINQKFDKQKNTITQLQSEIVNNQKIIDSLKNIIATAPKDTFYTEKEVVRTVNELDVFCLDELRELDSIKNWLHNAARETSLIFYHNGEVYKMSLTENGLRHIYTGNIYVLEKRRKRDQVPLNENRNYILDLLQDPRFNKDSLKLY